MSSSEPSEKRTVYQVYSGEVNRSETQVLFELTAHQSPASPRKSSSQATASQSTQSISPSTQRSSHPDLPNRRSSSTVSQPFVKHSFDLAAYQINSGSVAYGLADVLYEDFLKIGRQTLNDKRASGEEIVKQLLDRFQAGEWRCVFKGEDELRLDITGFEAFKLICTFDDEIDTVESVGPIASSVMETACTLVGNLNHSLQKNRLDAERDLQKDRDIHRLEKRVNALKTELDDKTLQMSRLLQSGGSSIEGLPGTGELIKGNRATERASTLSPSKKRKVEPTLAKAGRTVHKEVSTAFIDSDSEDGDDSHTDKDEERGSPSSAKQESKDKRKKKA